MFILGRARSGGASWCGGEEAPAAGSLTMNEMLRGVCDEYQERQRQREAGAEARVGGDLATLEPELP